MEQTLELVFKNAEGDTKVITVTDPREGITAQEADEAMDIILAANVIETSGGDLVEAVEARLRITQVTVLQWPTPYKNKKASEAWLDTKLRLL